MRTVGGLRVIDCRKSVMPATGALQLWGVYTRTTRNDSRGRESDR